MTYSSHDIMKTRVKKLQIKYWLKSSNDVFLMLVIQLGKQSLKKTNMSKTPFSKTRWLGRLKSQRPEFSWTHWTRFNRPLSIVLFEYSIWKESVVKLVPNFEDDWIKGYMTCCGWKIGNVSILLASNQGERHVEKNNLLHACAINARVADPPS